MTQNLHETNPGIYLIVSFDWPKTFTQEQAENARKLHDLTQESDWIQETVAASGGVGGSQGSIWIFWLSNYAALDRLLKYRSDEICNTYDSFFKEMENVSEYIREKVLFI